MSMKDVNDCLQANDERSVLIALLNNLPWGEVRPVDFTGLDDIDRAFLTITCCSSIILAFANALSGGDPEVMVQGIKELTADMIQAARKGPPKRRLH